MPEPTLFDAVSSAIDSDGTDTGATTHEDPAALESGAPDADGSLEEGHDPNADGSSEGDDKGGEQGGEDAGEDQPDGEGDENAAAARGADGKFVKKGEQPTDKADAKGKDQGAKQPDHVNDPIPKDLKPATQERMRFLVNETKKLSEAREKVQTDFNYMIQGIQATGTTPDQYREVLSFMSLFNSNDPSQQEKALELIESVADRLATVLGKDRSVSDPLAAHADLKAEVQGGKLTAERAKEIARHRNQGAFRTELSAAATKEQQEAQAAQRDREQARSDLNSLEEKLRGEDRDYDRIKARIMPVLKPIFATTPASQWLGRFNEAYRNVKAQLAASANARPRNPGNQPMRGGRGTGGGGGSGGNDMKSAPGTMLDAVSQALDSM